MDVLPFNPPQIENADIQDQDRGLLSVNIRLWGVAPGLPHMRHDQRSEQIKFSRFGHLSVKRVHDGKDV